MNQLGVVFLKFFVSSSIHGELHFVMQAGAVQLTLSLGITAFMLSLVLLLLEGPHCHDCLQGSG